MRTPIEQVHTLTATTDQLQSEVDSLKRVVLTIVCVQVVLAMLILRHWK